MDLKFFGPKNRLNASNINGFRGFCGPKTKSRNEVENKVRQVDKRRKPYLFTCCTASTCSTIPVVHLRSCALKTALTPMLTTVQNESGALNPNHSQPHGKIHTQQNYTQSPGQYEYQNPSALEHSSTRIRWSSMTTKEKFHSKKVSLDIVRTTILTAGFDTHFLCTQKTAWSREYQSTQRIPCTSNERQWLLLYRN